MAADESINENELISNVVPNDMNEGSLLGDIDVIRNYGTILGSIVHHDIPIHDLKEVILVQIYQAGMVIGQHHQEKALMDIKKHI